MSWQERLVMMKAAGVARQVLSPTTAPYSHDLAASQHASVEINNIYANLAKTQADQFDFWVSLPLPHIEQSLCEIDRGFDELNGVGVVLGCFCLERSIADPIFDPIYAELNRRKAVVFLHPCQNGICSHHINDWGLTVCAGASFEDSTAAMHLIAAQVPQRFPNIRFIVPHFGGILPTLLNRLDGQMPQNEFKEKPSVTAKRFFYDTVGWGSEAALLAALEAFGAKQIVTGSDFPILLRHESYTQTFDNVRLSSISESDKKQIMGNAYNLLY
jgi:predicted TIM-barrel fold metal-dependent hydrolase